MLDPNDAAVTITPTTRHVDNAMVKAIARAFRWRELQRLPVDWRAQCNVLAAGEKSGEQLATAV